MGYYDCTLSAGYYGILGGDVAEHTYAFAQIPGSNYAFPCFGGFARKDGDRGHDKVVYEAELWTPQMLGSQEQGKRIKGNLYVALGMAQASTAPNYAYKVEDWEKWWEKNPETSLSCWAGIVYGVHGVCHQACNRVLWASRESCFTDTPVNWPPSFSLTYWPYGYYGKITELVAIVLANELVRRATLQPSLVGGPREATPHAAGTADGQFTEGSARLTREALKAAPNEDRRREIRSMLEAAPGGKGIADSTAFEGIVAPDARFHASKRDLDSQLLRGEVSHDEYALKVNDACTRMLQDFRNVLPEKTFNALFPDMPKGKAVALIVREHMPDSYRPFQELIKI